MNTNNLGYKLDLDKCASILTQWNMTHENKIAWSFNDEETEITCQGVLPNDLQYLIDHAI